MPRPPSKSRRIRRQPEVRHLDARWENGRGAPCTKDGWDAPVTASAASDRDSAGDSTLEAGPLATFMAVLLPADDGPEPHGGLNETIRSTAG